MALRIQPGEGAAIHRNEIPGRYPTVGSLVTFSKKQSSLYVMKDQGPGTKPHEGERGKASPYSKRLELSSPHPSWETP